MKNLLPLIFILLSQITIGQETTCLELIADEQEHKENSIETKLMMLTKSDVDTVLRIPIVVHVIYKATSGKISPEQVASGIDNANEFWRKQYGTGAYDADVKIEYYLANIDPDGNPTTGIIYHDIDSSGLSPSQIQEYKDYGSSANTSNGLSDLEIATEYSWDTDQYLNYYIVTEFDGNGAGGGVQGKAYYPTTSIVEGGYVLYNAWGDKDDGYYDTNLDGFVSGLAADEGDATRNLKSYTNINKTLIHELGHSQGLRHPFGLNCTTDSDGFFVGDTGPTTVNQSCNSLACPDATPDLHMDYFPQQCRLRFTPDQKDYARAALLNSNSNLLESFNSVHEWKPTTIDVDFQLPATVCSTTQDYEITITNTGENTLEHLSILYGSNYATADTLDLALCLLPNQYKKITLPPLNEATTTVGVDILKVNTLDYEMQRIVRTTEVGDIEIVVEFVSDALGGQNSWTIERNGNVVASRESYPNFQEGTTHINTKCVKGGCLTFTFTDSENNGVCCYNGEGSLNIYVNGNLYATLPDTFTDVWSVSNCGEATLIGYYNFMGEKLPSEPTQGFYIERYSNGQNIKRYKQ